MHETNDTEVEWHMGQSEHGLNGIGSSFILWGNQTPQSKIEDEARITNSKPPIIEGKARAEGEHEKRRKVLGKSSMNSSPEIF